MVERRSETPEAESRKLPDPPDHFMARSSAGLERHSDTVEVEGSIPSEPTSHSFRKVDPRMVFNGRA